MLKGFFITGTDTSVGKTIISGVLIKALGVLGLRAGAMKPIETGCTKVADVLVAEDAVFLKSIAWMEEPITQITSYALKTPTAPLIAAEIEGVDIDIERIIHSVEELSIRYDIVLVEGAGGLLVPIKKDFFMLDLARRLFLPLIVVAKPTLGTINHTLLTVNYALKEGVDVAGVIINYSNPPQGTVAEETGHRVLRGILKVPILGIVPYMNDLSAESLERASIKYLDLEMIRKKL